MLTAAKANRRYFRDAYRTGVHGWAVHEPSTYAVGFLRELARLVPGGALLDAGCGEGRHAFAAAEMGFKVTAIDYEPLALRRARKFARAKKLEHVAFRRADVFHLPFADSSFDVVLDYGCLHHQRKSDWQRYGRAILRVLKPRGFYVLSVFSPKFRLFCGSQRPWQIASGAYRRYFTRKDIAQLFRGYFDIIEIVEQRGAEGGFWHVLMRRQC